jgi:hypothetical protein
MGDSADLYELSYEVRPEYLYAYIKGDLSGSETKVDCWREIIQRCRAGEHEKLLVVLDGPGNSTEIDAFESSREIVALGLSGIKIAYVDLDPANLENNQFGELVAYNRGAFAKVFTTEPEAHNWLIGPGN